MSAVSAVSAGIVVAIDPGPTESAFVRYLPAERRVLEFGKVPSTELLGYVSAWARLAQASEGEREHLAIEMVASYGMAVGAEVFDTCVWIGRFIQAWDGEYTQVYRKDVKGAICRDSRAKDSNIRAALLDRWGGKEAAMGSKRSPGPLFGISADVWSALAVAVTWSEGRA